MAKSLNFEGLAQEAEKNPELVAARSKRWGRREANPVVQMSVRMPESDYENFRQLCMTERRTNGEMVGVLMAYYVQGNKVPK